jgi:hypothetical protein
MTRKDPGTLEEANMQLALSLILVAVVVPWILAYCVIRLDARNAKAERMRYRDSQ